MADGLGCQHGPSCLSCPVLQLKGLCVLPMAAALPCPRPQLQPGVNADMFCMSGRSFLAVHSRRKVNPLPGPLLCVTACQASSQVRHTLYQHANAHDLLSHIHSAGLPQAHRQQPSCLLSTSTLLCGDTARLSAGTAARTM